MSSYSTTNLSSSISTASSSTLTAGTIKDNSPPILASQSQRSEGYKFWSLVTPFAQVDEVFMAIQKSDLIQARHMNDSDRWRNGGCPHRAKEILKQFKTSPLPSDFSIFTPGPGVASSELLVCLKQTDTLSDIGFRDRPRLYYATVVVGEKDSLVCQFLGEFLGEFGPRSVKSNRRIVIPPLCPRKSGRAFRTWTRPQRI